jgi:hypothetical protein
VELPSDREVEVAGESVLESSLPAFGKMRGIEAGPRR